MTFPEPLLFKASSNKAYCISVFVASINTTYPTSSYSVQISLSATAISGSYAGIGANSAGTPAGYVVPRKRVTKR